MNKPPFEINDKIINLVADINNKLGYLEANVQHKRALYLRKASKIKSVNSSCAIEANSLSLDEVESIVNGKKVIAPPNEILEVKNAYQSYSNIDKYKPYEIESFLTAHKELTINLLESAGKFRSGNVGVFENGIAIHMGAKPEYVYNLVNDLFIWGDVSELNPLIKACVLHYEIETIHPFDDGNGRIGRLWQSVVLYNYNKLFELIPIETLVYENQQSYYDAIEDSRKINSSTPFIEFMLLMILKAIDEFDDNSLKNIKHEVINNLTRSEKEVLKVIIDNYNVDTPINTENLSNYINKAVSSIRTYFKSFTTKNILIASGTNKGRTYKINTDIFK